MALIRWVGGKGRLWPVLQHWIPKDKVLWEPFAGGLSITLNRRPPMACVNDLDSDLINFWRHVKSAPEALYYGAKDLPSDKEFFMEYRKSEPKTDLDRAIKFFYLSVHSFKGVIRVGPNGNTTNWGGFEIKKRHLVEILSASRILQSVLLFNEDYRKFCGRIQDGFVYFDPPYDNAKQEGYSSIDVFELRRVCDAIPAPVLISNWDTPKVREAFAGYKFTEIKHLHNYMNRAVTELLIRRPE